MTHKKWHIMGIYSPMDRQILGIHANQTLPKYIYFLISKGTGMYAAHYILKGFEGYRCGHIANNDGRRANLLSEATEENFTNYTYIHIWQKTPNMDTEAAYKS